MRTALVSGRESPDVKVCKEVNRLHGALRCHGTESFTIGISSDLICSQGAVVAPFWEPKPASIRVMETAR